MRLFIAIDLTEEVKEVLSSIRRDIQGVRWCPSGQLHLTLHFCGEVASGDKERLINGLAAIAIEPFMLMFDRIGFFPNARSPRVLWTGTEYHPFLEKLAQRVKEAASASGIPSDEKPFFPHVTLARLKQPLPCNSADTIVWPIPGKKLSMEVNNLVLYQSRLTQQGAIHEKVRVFNLL